MLDTEYFKKGFLKKDIVILIDTIEIVINLFELSGDKAYKEYSDLKKNDILDPLKKINKKLENYTAIYCNPKPLNIFPPNMDMPALITEIINIIKTIHRWSTSSAIAYNTPHFREICQKTGTNTDHLDYRYYKYIHAIAALTLTSIPDCTLPDVSDRDSDMGSDYASDSEEDENQTAALTFT